MKTILVTGGAGYIGSHTVIELLDKGYDVVIVDNLANSSQEAVNRIKKITGKDVKFINADIRDKKALEEIFSTYKIYSVIHFAGLKAVGESCRLPLEYYDNNIGGTITLLKVMQKHNVKKIIFSSSATVYGTPTKLPLCENSPTGGTTNPYGTTKLYIERILNDLYASDNSWSIVLLRYFNPIGAHESGLIGEDPNGIPNNLLPYISRVAVGKLEKIHVYGNDYNTKDGTGVRDYVHVVDLASGHLAALKKHEENGVFIYNLGTGNGYSVLEVIHAFEKACGKELPYVIDPRRPGDIDASYASSTKAEKELGWKARYTIEDMCASSWKWQKNNPNGLK